MATKTSQIIEIVQSNENITQRQIAKRVGCTEGYVSKVKKSIGNTDIPPAEREPVDPVDPDDTEFESETTDFVKRTKITPDTTVLTKTDNEPEVKSTTYQCYSCGAEWQGDENDYQKQCPECGEEF